MSIDPRRRILFFSRFFRQVDPIDRQLADLARQGSGMARVAHMCATLLVVLFSAGSLVALGSDALNKILTDWQRLHTLDIPSIISVTVSTLLVLAFDVSMLQAASMLRLLSSRHASLGERWLHIAVMAIVAALEASTYWYMSWQYEHPATAAAGALIIARALAAPLLAVYLSMSRVLAVTSRDILGMVELASGAGVLRDVTQAARDPSASLDRKLRLYGSAAIMTAPDRARLRGMIEAVGTNANTPLLEAPESPYIRTYNGSGSPDGVALSSTGIPRLEAPESAYSGENEPPDRPPTGPGSPMAAPARTTPEKTSQSGTIKLVPERPRRVAASSSNPRTVRTPRKAVNHEQVARKAWASGATSVEKMRRATGMSRAAASSWVRSLKMERDTRIQQQPVEAQEAAQ